MNPETIKSIAGLWPLSLIIFLFTFIFLFKPQIAEFLQRFASIQIRKGDNEVTIIQQDNKENEKVFPPQGILEESSKSDIVEKQTSSELTEVVDMNSLTNEELNKELFFAFWRNEIDKGEEIFNRLQAIEDDQVSRYKNESSYLFLRFSTGDTSALEKLHELEVITKSYPSANSSVYFYIGLCHKNVNQFEPAISAFNKSASLSQQETHKASCLSSISDCYFSLGQKDCAIDILEEGIQHSSNEEALSKLYLSLADLFDKNKDNNLRAIALEKALEFQPNNSSTKFNTAYSYGEADFNNLSLYHYKTLISFSPENESGLNNLGVVYGELQMPIYSIKYYKRAWKKKNTLAASNLAYQYLNAGFFDEAKNILEEAKIEEDIHPNIGSAISALYKNEEKEKDIEDKIIKKALEQQRFLLNFAQNYFEKVSKTVEITGTWVIDGIISTFTQTGSQIVGEWGEDDKRRKFSGHIKNKGAVLKFEKWGYTFSTMTKTFINDGEGYAYLSSDLNTLHVMLLGKNDFELLTFIKQNQVNGEEDIDVSKPMS